MHTVFSISKWALAMLVVLVVLWQTYKMNANQGIVFLVSYTVSWVFFICLYFVLCRQWQPIKYTS